MVNLSGRLDSPNLFSLGCETSQRRFEPYVNADEANGLRFPCDSRPDNIVSCQNPNRALFLEEVNGLDFTPISISQESMDLPPFVPILDRRLFDLPGSWIRSQTLGVSLEDIFSSAPQKRNGAIVQSRLVVRPNVLDRAAFAGKKVILFCSGRDILIETLWQKFHSLGFAKVIAEMGFTGVTGINFSVFFGECPFAHALNLKKSLESARLFHNVGLRVIPHLYFAHNYHVDRWIAWLKKNPSVNTVAINCQFRSAVDASIIEQGIVHILERVHRELRFVLEGPDPKKLVSLLRTYPGRIVIAMKGISITAEFDRQYSFSNGAITKVDRGSANVESLLNASVENYTEYLQSLSRPQSSDAEASIVRQSASVRGVRGLPMRRNRSASVRI